MNGYVTGIFAPGRCEHALEEPYLVAHHQLLAHAEAVSVYRNKYQVCWSMSLVAYYKLHLILGSILIFLLIGNEVNIVKDSVHHVRPIMM